MFIVAEYKYSCRRQRSKAVSTGASVGAIEVYKRQTESNYLPHSFFYHIVHIGVFT